MRVLILRSIKSIKNYTQNDYSVSMNTNFADRFISHLIDKENYCNACANNCIKCRKKYNLNFSKSIIKILEFPSLLQAIIENPEKFIPDKILAHNVLIAISVNEEILISFLERFSFIRALIVPIEGSDWISKNSIRYITEFCTKNSIEISFPKPFCSFNPTEGILMQFKKMFKIGLPEIDFKIKDGKINKTKVVTSAPCGATYYTANCLKNSNINDNISYLINKSLSCFPCTSSTTLDRDFNDSIRHQACKIHVEALIQNLNKQLITINE